MPVQPIVKEHDVSTNTEARARAETYLKELWRGFPVTLGLVLTTVDLSLRGIIRPLAWLDAELAQRVRNIYAHFGCKLPS